MFRRGITATLLALALAIPAAGVVSAARVKEVAGGGYGCNFGSFIVSASWGRKGGSVASVSWTRWRQDGSNWVEEATTVTQPDDALNAHVTWSNMPEGYYSYSFALLSRQGAILASFDQRPTTQYCYAWP